MAAAQVFFDLDREMYWAKEDVPFNSRTTTLNEELGQVCFAAACSYMQSTCSHMQPQVVNMLVMDILQHCNSSTSWDERPMFWCWQYFWCPRRLLWQSFAWVKPRACSLPSRCVLCSERYACSFFVALCSVV